VRRLLWLILTCLMLLPVSGITPTKKKKTTTKSAKKHRAPKPPAATPAQRVEARAFVDEHAADAMDLGIQNPAALIPFFERLYRSQQAETKAVVSVLQYGDSHTASDDWPNSIRVPLQKVFGDGGPGFVHAGHPFEGYRRFDAKGSQSRGWLDEGLLRRDGDGLYGLAGIRATATRAGETLTLSAEGSHLELFYWRQPGGGALTVEENGAALGRIETAGDAAAAFWSHALSEGAHTIILRTESSAPVTIFGWVMQKQSGLTWETLGINGAQADLLQLWNEPLLKADIEQRDPGLIVLAYGTNEARRADWTMETYRDSLRQVLKRLRAAAPTASILVIGAPDQSIRTKARWATFDGVDRILAAQREAADAEGCAFWNLRMAMGGKGSMKQWVQAGLAQGDFVHLTGTGYHLWGDSLAQLLLQNYSVYQTVRRRIFGSSENGSPLKTH
jgi:lysophospholipase L1-like esterase